MKYGNLIIMGDAGTSTSGQRLWRCACFCGRETTVLKRNVVSGNTKTCGHCNRSIISPGDTFGDLTARKNMGTDKHRHRRWECMCNCGTIVTVLAHNLIAGSSMSCGKCPKYSHLHIGQTFNHLVVLELQTTSGSYLCGCDCGNPDKIKIAGSRLTEGRRKSCGKCDDFLTSVKPTRYFRVSTPQVFVDQYPTIGHLAREICRVSVDCVEILNPDTNKIIWRKYMHDADTIMWGVWSVPGIDELQYVKDGNYD